GARGGACRRPGLGGPAARAPPRGAPRRAGTGCCSVGVGGAGRGPAPAAAAEPLPDVPEWPDAEKLKYEKEVLDFYFSSHPLARREKELRRFATHTAEQLKQLQPNEEVTLGGMMVEVQYRNTK